MSWIIIRWNMDHGYASFYEVGISKKGYEVSRFAAAPQCKLLFVKERLVLGRLAATDRQPCGVMIDGPKRQGSWFRANGWVKSVVLIWNATH